MKTYKQWAAQSKDFMAFIEDGDEIDGEMYHYFLGVVPPRMYISGSFLCGEPATVNERGEALYQTFYHSPTGRYSYGGLQTVRQWAHYL